MNFGTASHRGKYRTRLKSRLAPHQVEIGRLIASGHSNKLIAHLTGRTTQGVKTGIYRIYQRAGVNCRVDFIRWWHASGFSASEHFVDSGEVVRMGAFE